MSPVEAYLHALHTIRASGSAVPETSYYGTLEALINEIGRTLKPRVRCVINIGGKGAGIPDGGLFTADQFHKASGSAVRDGQLPARGVLEVKGTGADVTVVARSEQVRKYLDRYGQVLVSNYRDFLLVVRGVDGRAEALEAYHLAPDEASFWTAAPRLLAALHGERLVE